MPREGQQFNVRAATPARADGTRFYKTIGVAWYHEGDGERDERIDIRLDALPMSPELTLWPADARDANGTGD
jgi:hypothetical protein